MPPVNKLKTYGRSRKSSMCRSLLLNPAGLIQKASNRKKKKIKIRELPARKNAQTLLSEDSLQVSTEDTFDKLVRQKQRSDSNKRNQQEEQHNYLTADLDSFDKLFKQNPWKNSNKINESKDMSVNYIVDTSEELSQHKKKNTFNAINGTGEKSDNFTLSNQIFATRLGEPSLEKIEDSIEIETVRRNKEESLSYINLPKLKNRLNCNAQQSFILSSTPLTFFRGRKKEVVNSTISPISKQLAYEISEINKENEQSSKENSYQKLSLIDSLNKSSLNYINLRSRSILIGSKCCSKHSDCNNSNSGSTHLGALKERNFSTHTNNSSDSQSGNVSKNKTDHIENVKQSVIVCSNVNYSETRSEYFDSMEVSRKPDNIYLQYSELLDSMDDKYTNFITERRKQAGFVNSTKCDDISAVKQKNQNIEDSHNMSIDNEYSILSDKKVLSDKDKCNRKSLFNSKLSNTCNNKQLLQLERDFKPLVWDGKENDEELVFAAPSINADSFQRSVSVMQCSDIDTDISVLYNRNGYTNMNHSMNDSSRNIHMSIEESALPNNSLPDGSEKNAIDSMDVSLKHIRESKHELTEGDNSINESSESSINSNAKKEFSQLSDVSMQETTRDDSNFIVAENLSSSKQFQQSQSLDLDYITKDFSQATDVSMQEKTSNEDQFSVAENLRSCIQVQVSANSLNCDDTGQVSCHSTDSSEQEITGVDHFKAIYDSNHQESCDVTDEISHDYDKSLVRDSVVLQKVSVCSSSLELSHEINDKGHLVVNLTNCFHPQPNESHCSDVTGTESQDSSVLGEYFVEQKHLVINLTNNCFNHHLLNNTTLSFDETSGSASDETICRVGNILLNKKQLRINLTNHIYPECLPDNITISLRSEHSSENHDSVFVDDFVNQKQLVVNLSNHSNITQKDTDQKDNLANQFHGFTSDEQAKVCETRRSNDVIEIGKVKIESVDIGSNSSDIDLIECSVVEPMTIDFTQFKKPEPMKTLKAGKLWRRSFSVYKKQNNCHRSTIGGGGNCNCIECSKLTKTTFLNNRRVSTRIVPVIVKPEIELEPFKEISDLEEYAIVSGYVQSAAEQERLQRHLENSFRCLSLRRRSSIVESRPLTARDIVLRKCGQTEPITFEKCYPNKSLQNCHKIGEGVYGEVFLLKNSTGGTSVLKIIPIEGDLVVNGERQKKFEEILSEIIIATELHNLRYNTTNKTSNFSEVQKIQCVQGRYPERLLDLWDLYNETKVSENDCPEIFGDDQLYIVLQLGNAGRDLESYVFNNAIQAFSMFKQVAFGLAIAEESLKFEHRDLHWGNVLLNTVEKNKTITYYLDGKPHTFTSYGVEATIIDFTLSRIEDDGVVIFNDLSLDPDLFTAEGDYQFEVYRLMQKKNGNNWQIFEPYTNVLWLHYVLDKSVTALRYKYPQTKTHKECLARMKKLANEILAFKSAKDFVTNYFL